MPYYQLGSNDQTNWKIVQDALNYLLSNSITQVIGGNLYDNGRSKTLEIPKIKKTFKILGSQSTSCDTSAIGDAVASTCCGTTPHFAVEVQPDGCGGWNDVAPDLDEYVLFEANGSIMGAGTIVEAEKGVKDEWLFFAASGYGGGENGSSITPDYTCMEVMVDLRCDGQVTVKEFGLIPTLAGVECVLDDGGSSVSGGS